MTSVTAREAELRDLNDLLALGKRFYLESPACSGMSFDPDAVLETILESMEIGGAFVLENAKGVVVGGVLGRVDPTWYGDDVIASVHALYVDPEWRGMGWRLVRLWAAWAAERGANRLDLDINSGLSEDRTWAMLERMGWKIVGGSTTFSLDS